MNYAERASIFVGAALILASASSANAQHQYVIHYGTPSLDRWMYPFASTPGQEATISTFGSTPGGTDFDSRDGQGLIRFDTGNDIPAGLGASNYIIDSLTVTLQYSNDMVVQYDNTQDPWQSFLDPSDPNYVADPDPGQPVELFGCGYRNGWSLDTFTESTPYTLNSNSPLWPQVRNAYCMSYDADHNPIDVSINPRQGFDPKVWATGIIDGLNPGDYVPINSKIKFTVDVSDPDIQAYLKEGVNAGKLMFGISSLTFVVQQGGNFPRFYTKENAFVQLNLASAAQLDVSVRTGPFCPPADLNCDGIVNGADLGLLIGNWGNAGTGDLNGDGVVNGADLGALLGAWGPNP